MVLWFSNLEDSLVIKDDLALTVFTVFSVNASEHVQLQRLCAHIGSAVVSISAAISHICVPASRVLVVAIACEQLGSLL